MDKLSVINRMLVTVGEAPVNTLDNPDELTAKAISVLDNETMLLQSKNYWFNYYPTVLPLDVNGEITLPSNTTRVDANNTSIIQRGLKLYNKYNNTFTFPQPLEVYLTVSLAFDEIPFSAKALTSAMAEWVFEAQEQGDTAISQTLRFNLERANVVFKDEDLQQQNNNIYRNSSVQSVYNRQVLGQSSLRTDVRGY